MSSEDTMDGRSGSSQAPSDDAAAAGEVEDVAQEAPAPCPCASSSPVAAADGSAAGMGAYTGVLYLQQRHQWPPTRQQSEEEEDDDPKRMRARWFNDMRGWLVVLAVQVASVTCQAGLNPPEGFKDKNDGESPNPKSKRYYMFFYFNTTAFVTSLAIIILLMNRSFYHSEAKVVALEVIVVLDMVGLMGAYWEGSTRADQTAKYTLVLILLVLFALYVVYTVQILPRIWRLVVAAARVRDGDAGGTLRVPRQIDEARSLQLPPQDENVNVVGRSISVPRRRGSSRLAGVAGAEPSPASRMMSP